MIDLAPEAADEVRKILRRRVPEFEVRAFGSRVDGTARRFSDLDLAIVSPGPLSEDILAVLKDDFAESDLPISVDVVDWSALPEGLQAAIGDRYELMQKGSTNDPASSQ
jgi:predicted nucleotidyltransferase